MERGYRPRSVRVQLRLLADLSAWLAGEGREPAELTGDDAARFLRGRRERVVDLTGARALGPLLGYLRGLGVVPERLGRSYRCQVVVMVRPIGPAPQVTDMIAAGRVRLVGGNRSATRAW